MAKLLTSRHSSREAHLSLSGSPLAANWRNALLKTHRRTHRRDRLTSIDQASGAFAAALKSVPNDGPSATFIKRIDGLMANPFGNEWDGSWHLEQK